MYFEEMIDAICNEVGDFNGIKKTEFFNNNSLCFVEVEEDITFNKMTRILNRLTEKNNFAFSMPFEKILAFENMGMLNGK